MEERHSMEYLEQIGIQAKEAEAVLRTLGSRDKDQALRKAAEYLEFLETGHGTDR